MGCRRDDRIYRAHRVTVLLVHGTPSVMRTTTFCTPLRPWAANSAPAACSASPVNVYLAVGELEHVDRSGYKHWH